MEELKQVQDRIFWKLFNEKKIQLAHFSSEELDFFDELQGGPQYAPSFGDEKIRCYIDLAFVFNDPKFRELFESGFETLEKEKSTSNQDHHIMDYIKAGQATSNFDYEPAHNENPIVEELAENGQPLDNEIAWMPTDILNYFDSILGAPVINPEDGLPQYGGLKSLLGKGFRFLREKVAPAVGQSIGASLGGPAGATAGRYLGERIAGTKHKLAWKKSAAAGIGQLAGNIAGEYGGMGEIGQSIGQGVGQYAANRWQGINKQEAINEGLQGGIGRYMTSGADGSNVYSGDEGIMGALKAPFSNTFNNGMNLFSKGKDLLLGSSGGVGAGEEGGSSLENGGGDVFERAGMGPSDNGTSQSKGGFIDSIKNTLFGSQGTSNGNSGGGGKSNNGQLGLLEKLFGKGNTLPGLAASALMFKGYRDEKKLAQKARDVTDNRAKEAQAFVDQQRAASGFYKPLRNQLDQDQLTPVYTPRTLNESEYGHEKKHFVTKEELAELKKKLLPGYAKGGTVKKVSPKFNGLIKGAGGGTTDSIKLDNLYDGGFVMRAKETKNLGVNNLNRLVNAVLERNKHIKVDDNPEPIKALVSNGEYDFSPEFVTKLGGGSNKKGSSLLYKLQDSSSAKSKQLLEKLLKR